jgi:hypothetical protein
MAALVNWLAVEGFRYSPASDELATARLLASLRDGFASPANPVLLVDQARRIKTYAPAGSECLKDGLWQVNFELPLEIVQCPDSMFALGAPGLAALALPAPTLLAAGARTPGRGSLIARALAFTAIASCALSAPAVAATRPAGTVPYRAPAGLQVRVSRQAPGWHSHGPAGQVPVTASASNHPGAHRHRKSGAHHEHRGGGTNTRHRAKPGQGTSTAHPQTLGPASGSPMAPAPAPPIPLGAGTSHHHHRHRHHHRHHAAGQAAHHVDSVTQVAAPPANAAPSTGPSVLPPQFTTAPGVPENTTPAAPVGAPPAAGEFARLAAVFANSSADQPPAVLVPFYKEAARRYRVPWTVLAAINQVETNYGLDLNVSSAGAVGWMQFMPGTWRQYGVAADGATANPYDPRDAILAAGSYLQANGAGKDLRDAIFAYNHSWSYVDEVLFLSRQIALNQLHPDADAQAKLTAMLTTAQLLNGLPYVYGGGHADWTLVSGYDCSGFVSSVLHAAGYLDAPVNTQALPGQPGILTGPGRWVTIFDRTDAPAVNEDHVIIYVNGQWWESGGSGAGAGVHRMATISAGYLATFNRILHPQGL